MKPLFLAMLMQWPLLVFCPWSLPTNRKEAPRDEH